MKFEVSLEQDRRASGTDEATAGVLGVAERPHLGLSSAVGQISSRQSGQDYKIEW